MVVAVGNLDQAASVAPSAEKAEAESRLACEQARHVAATGGRPSTLTVDLSAMVANLALVRARAAPAEVAAIVKANGYGLGAVPITLALRRAGCRWFFVATLNEAASLIPELDDACEVYVLNGLHSGEEPACAELGALPVLNSLHQAKRWAALSLELDKRLRAAVQVDSGMSRLGMAPEEVDALLSEPEVLANLEPLLLMSHLACADDPGAAVNQQQIRLFGAIAARFPSIRRSLANSGGVFLGSDAHFDVVRAGIALYGGSPQIGRDCGLTNVVTLEAPVIQRREVPAGKGVGYGLTGAADRGRRIATVALGYADGWPRRLGNTGSAFISGVRVPIVGTISMDSMMLDVTDLPHDAVWPGAMVEFLGPHQNLDDVARDAETISYEILTQLGQRLERNYTPYVSQQQGPSSCG